MVKTNFRNIHLSKKEFKRENLYIVRYIDKKTGRKEVLGFDSRADAESYNKYHPKRISENRQIIGRTKSPARSKRKGLLGFW